MNKKSTYKIPFCSQTGKPLSYPVFNVVYKDNYVFDATLTYNGFSRGRSAANFCLIDEKINIEYNIFMKDMDIIIRRGLLVNGKITGKWTFQKRGMNFGIRLVEFDKIVNKDIIEFRYNFINKYVNNPEYNQQIVMEFLSMFNTHFMLANYDIG